MKKRNRNIVIILMSLSMLLVASATATLLPPALFESQGITLTTDTSAIGSFSNIADLSWRHASAVLDGNLHLEVIVDPVTGEIIEKWVSTPEPPLDLGEMQMNSVYTETTNAQYGSIDYSKTSMVETKALPGNMPNIENERIVSYTGIDGNRILSDEDFMLSAVGAAGIHCKGSAICVFCGDCGTCDCYPPFCTLVDTGSSIDMNNVSVRTDGEIRNLNKASGSDLDWPPLASSDGPAHLQYSVRVTELSPGQPSVGYVSTYLKSETHEGRLCTGEDLFQVINLEDRRSVDGKVYLFANSVDYISSCCR